MDIITSDFHPNWCALATINLRLKRFVRATNNESEVTPEVSKYELRNLDGTEIKEFYENITSTDESHSSKSLTTVNTSESRRKSPQLFKKITFDTKTFFRLATTNNVHELEKFDFNEANINVTDSFGWTALMMAACEGSRDAVEFLLRIGCDKSIADRAKNTALDLALKKGHMDVVDLLQDDKFSTSNADDIDETILAHHCNNPSPFYCSDCKQEFKETTLAEHETSTVHLLSRSSTVPGNRLQKFNIPEKNRGLQLMVKQGWDKESGLGPQLTGRLYPIKTVLRKRYTGLGIEQDVARVTHFKAFDKRATQNRDLNFYKKKARNRNDIMRERHREWKRERRLRRELS